MEQLGRTRGQRVDRVAIEALDRRAEAGGSVSMAREYPERELTSAKSDVYANYIRSDLSYLDKNFGTNVVD